MLLLPSLLNHGRDGPTRPALFTDEESVPFEQFLETVAGVAQALRARGIRPGERVVFECPNDGASVALYFGIHAAGCIAVPLHVHSERSLDYILRATEPGLVVASELPGHIDVPRCLPEALVGAAGSPRDIVTPAEHAPADILFTTGTTSRPKGVVLTHGNIAAAALNIATRLGQRPDDREVVPIPMSHSFGLGRIRCMALVGNAVALLPGMRSPKRIFDVMERISATGLAMVPSGFAYLRRVAPDMLARFSNDLRYVEIGSAPIDAPTKEWLERSLPRTPLLHHYGLTEASRAAFVDLHGVESDSGCIGRASPNVEIEVRDADDNAVIGEVGEICVRGKMIMREYLNQPALTAKVLRQGWLHTGDLGVMDEHGRLTLHGRQGDTINVGGLKVAPQEVEEYLCQVPEIRAAACVAMDDPNGISGQRVRAFVVVDGELVVHKVLAYLRSQKLASHMLPAEFLIVDELPRTSSGKLRRAVLRERVEDEAME